MTASEVGILLRCAGGSFLVPSRGRQAKPEEKGSIRVGGGLRATDGTEGGDQGAYAQVVATESNRLAQGSSASGPGQIPQLDPQDALLLGPAVGADREAEDALCAAGTPLGDVEVDHKKANQHSPSGRLHRFVPPTS
jgi:hypothetical protein